MNELHHAAEDGSVERTLAVLSMGVIDIDRRDVAGTAFTPLMFASYNGHSRVVRILLNREPMHLW